MKATVFYDEIASALGTGNFLQRIGQKRHIKDNWEMHLWHSGVLRFPSVADEALKKGMDADIIVFAGCRANLLRPWMIRWLERWISVRLTEHAVLAFVDGQFTDICPQMNEFELSEFVSRHNISFAACDELDLLQTQRDCFVSLQQEQLPCRAF
jgi:hypothetical protein